MMVFLQRTPMLAIVRAIDSRSRDCGNDGIFLQRRPMLAMLLAIDSRSRDCGNDCFFLQRRPMLAMLLAIDSRSGGCWYDGVFYLQNARELESKNRNNPVWHNQRCICDGVTYYHTIEIKHLFNQLWRDNFSGISSRHYFPFIQCNQV
jgi:hypothetical protein